MVVVQARSGDVLVGRDPMAVAGAGLQRCGAGPPRGGGGVVGERGLIGRTLGVHPCREAT
jgi:hypothetical protein